MNALKRTAAAVLAALLVITYCGCNADVPPVSVSEVTQEASDIAVTSDISLPHSGGSLPEDSTEPAASSTAAVAATTADSTEDPESAEPKQATTSAAPVQTTQPEQPAVTTASTLATAAKTTAATAKPAEKPVEKEKGLTAAYSVTNSWQEDGKECSQLEVTVRNGYSYATDSWKLEIDLGQNIEVMQFWNADVTASGTKLIASNVEYNGVIAAGGETGFGCIVKTASPVKDGAGSSSGSSTTPAVTTTTAASISAPPKPSAVEKTGRAGLVSEHGQLSVNGTDLVDENGKPFQLRGVSTHGIQWFPAYANKDAFRHLRDEWNINVIRLAMYSGAGEGYTDSTKAGIEKTVQNAVDYAIELDMYVIIDWHVLQDQSPQVRKADALRFFGYMSEKYADYPNVIYEICNEPNGYATWSGDVKPYAEEVIPVIRRNDPDSVIIVGTPTWSQDIDKALADPLKYDNVMYALHYYAATHTDWLRDRLKSCYNSGLPIMVTEFGNCDASGNGSNNFAEAEKWLTLLDSLNISYMNWSLCDKAESASLLKPGAPASGGWSDSQLTENGLFMKKWLSEH